MLKLRLQGTKNDIRWFLKLLSRDKRFDVENTSTFFSNKGTDKYKRLYTEIYRKDKRNNDELILWEYYLVYSVALGVNNKIENEIIEKYLQNS